MGSGGIGPRLLTLAVTLGPLLLNPAAAGARKQRQAMAPSSAAGPPPAMALLRGRERRGACARRRAAPPSAMWRGGEGHPSAVRPERALLSFGGVQGRGGAGRRWRLLVVALGLGAALGAPVGSPLAEERQRKEFSKLVAATPMSRPPRWGEGSPV